jgi:hypothetical protein
MSNESKRNRDDQLWEMLGDDLDRLADQNFEDDIPDPPDVEEPGSTD